MYGTQGVGVTGSGVVAGAAVLPNTGGNTILTVMIAAIVVIGTIATITQLGVMGYRNRALKQL